jgi:hypothetical protein
VTDPSYQGAIASGDYSLAISSLRRFYDHKLPESSKSQHAHGLLNLAAFYYQTGGVESARTVSSYQKPLMTGGGRGDPDSQERRRQVMSSALYEVSQASTRLISLSHQITMTGRSEAGPSTPGARRATLSHLPKPSTSNDELVMLLTALDLVSLTLTKLTSGRTSPRSVPADPSRPRAPPHSVQGRDDPVDISPASGSGCLACPTSSDVGRHG